MREKKRVTAAKSATPLLIPAIAEIVEFVAGMANVEIPPKLTYGLSTGIFTLIVGLFRFIKR